MKKLLSLVLTIALSLPTLEGEAQNLKPLTHDVYDSWKIIKSAVISNNGKYVAYELNPQLGDGWLHIVDVTTGQRDSIFRGASPQFSADSDVLLFRLKPSYDSVRKAKLIGLKKEKLPKDSVGILNLNSREQIRLAAVKQVQIPKESSEWLAVFVETAKKENKDSEEKKTKSSKKKKDNMTGQLVLLHAQSLDSMVYQNVSQFSLSDNGRLLAMVQTSNDSIDSIRVSTYNTRKSKLDQWFAEAGYSENIIVDKMGAQLAFTYSDDSAKNKAYGLYYLNMKHSKLLSVSGDGFSRLKVDWSVSPFGKIFFNDSGSELYFGSAIKPINEAKDTLTADEKVNVDIWNWKDPLLQTEQLEKLEREKKRSYTAVYFTKDNQLVQLGNEKLESIRLNKKSKGMLSLASTHRPYQKQSSWDGSWYNDYHIIDRKTGESKLILKAAGSSVSLSPQQKFIAWYNIADSSWNVYDVKTNVSAIVSADMRVAVYNENNDIPNEAGPYGMAGWTDDDKLVIYDRYDLWLLDPLGRQKAINLTNGKGRSTKNRFRYIKLDRDAEYLPKTMLLSVFDTENKEAGFYQLSIKNDEGSLTKLMTDDYLFTRPIKARNADKLLWTKESFKKFPDYYVSGLEFENQLRLTNANPQQKNYKWGDVELVEWVAFSGDSLQGLLYKPYDYDSSKSYPMLVYFYERYSDKLHKHYYPKPIRSVINFSCYSSNDYFIFVPDIIYTEGHPGPNAVNCVLSGTQAMCERFPFIDRKRLGIQGQSWGGYQTAYIITQTNMYKAAMAGAPVSNMTSAYGGIRWESGRSRAFQYEETQSRIGGTLWEKLPLYIENSPLFFVDRIETPLLIMHNDKDGAVPWYQGIEMFNALRRLHKPAWMLVYNGAPHNLKRRADMNDLSIRMQQFFDHFLKDAPEPMWMKEGIPALQKGKTLGYELD